MSTDKITVGYADEQWTIPLSEYQKGTAKQYIEQQIAKREADAAAAAKAASAEAMHAVAMQKQMAEMQQLMEAQQAQLAQLQSENEKLRQASPEASAAAMALMNATANAQELRTGLVRDMAMLEEFKNERMADAAIIADQLRRNRSGDEAAQKAKRDAMREYFEHIRAGGASIPAMEQQTLPVVIEPEGGVAT